MMDPMADNDHQPPPPAEPPPAEAAPPPAPVPVEQPAPPPAVRAPTEITPEQVRQFQEFQQFQELMRKAADDGLQPPATPPPPGFLQPWGPPPKQPSAPVRFLKALAGKIVTGIIVVLLLVVGGYLAIDYFFGADEEQGPASETGGRGPQGNRIYSTNPYEAVRQIYDYIAQNRDGVKDTNLVCLKFTEDAAERFAGNLGYPDCEAAVIAVSEEVTDPDAYAESMPSASQEEVTGDIIRISSCEDNIRGGIEGGPPLGVFTATKIEGSVGGQWIISGHDTEPACELAPTTTP